MAKMQKLEIVGGICKVRRSRYSRVSRRIPQLCRQFLAGAHTMSRRIRPQAYISALQYGGRSVDGGPGLGRSQHSGARARFAHRLGESVLLRRSKKLFRAQQGGRQGLHWPRWGRMLVRPRREFIGHLRQNTAVTVTVSHQRRRRQRHKRRGADGRVSGLHQDVRGPWGFACVGRRNKAQHVDPHDG